MPPKKVQEPEKKPLIGRVGTNLRVGIVGVPNVGKSTFFNVLTKSSAAAENFPFCTIDPNENKKIMSVLYKAVEIDYNELERYCSDNLTICRKRFLPKISGTFCEGETFEEPKEPKCYDGEWYPFCNSYYPSTEDVDAFSRVNHLLNLRTPSTPLKKRPGNSRKFANPKNFYSTLEAQLDYLSSKPLSFLILGKPSIGEEELGKELANYWQCVYIDPETLIKEEIEAGTRAGQCIEFNLRCGRAIGIDVILRLVGKRVKTESVAHRGFVLCGLPVIPNDLYEEDPISTESAIFTINEIFEEIMENLSPKPTEHLLISTPSRIRDLAETPRKISRVEWEDAQGSKSDSEIPRASSEKLRQSSDVRKKSIADNTQLKSDLPDLGDANLPVCEPPEISTDYETQLDFVMDLFEGPFMIIYMVCENQDVVNKRNEYRYDIYSETLIDVQKEKAEKNLLSLFTANTKFGFGVNPPLEQIFEDIPRLVKDSSELVHLVKLPRDFPGHVQTQLQIYHQIATRLLESKILDHDPEFFLKVDGRTTTVRIFNAVKWKLRISNVRKVLFPEKIIDEDSYDIEAEGENENKKALDFDNLQECFDKFSRRKIVNLMFKWEWSDWGTRCPVAMAEGTYVDGDPKYAVHFMNYIFFLSNQEAFIKFYRNPRPYLVPPNPKSHGKIYIIGPGVSGKTAVSDCLAYLIDGTVLSPPVLHKEFVDKRREIYVDRLKQAKITSKLTQINADLMREHQEQKRLHNETVQEGLRKFRSHIEQQLQQRKSKSEISLLKLSSFPALMGTVEKEQEEQKIQLDDMFIPDSIAREILEKPEVMKRFLPKNLLEEFPDFAPVTFLEEEDMNEIEESIRTSDMDEIALGEEDLFEMYTTAIRNEEEKYVQRQNCRGGWIVDGLTGDFHFFQRVYDECPPNHVIILEDSSKGDFLKTRHESLGLNVFTDFHEFFMKIGKPEIAARIDKADSQFVKERIAGDVIREILQGKEFLTEPGDKKDGTLTDEVLHSRRHSHVQYKSDLEDYDSTKMQIIEFLRNMNKDFILLDVKDIPLEELLKETVISFESKYLSPATIFTDRDLLIEAQEFGNNDDNEGGEGVDKTDQNEFEANRRYGDTFNYCPVTFHDHWVLWKGRKEFMAKFLGKLYFFANQENLDLFLYNPRKYLPITKPFPAFPPPRICVIGNAGSGKTSISKAIADNFGLCHCKYIEFLNKKGAEDENSEYYNNIKEYLTGDIPLPDEILPEFLNALWFEEPYKSMGFVIDDFPKRPSDFPVMINLKTLPDIIIQLNVGEKDLIQRYITKELSDWQLKQDILRTEEEQDRTETLFKWEKAKRDRFDQLMAVRRQHRYSLKKKLKEEDKEQKPVRPYMEDIPETDEEVDNTYRSKSQVTLDSQEEQADIDEVNDIIKDELPEPTFERVSERIEEAKQRIREKFDNSYSNENHFFTTMKELSLTNLIQWQEIKADKQLEITKYEAYILLDDLVTRDKSFFERTYEISIEVAEILLTNGYYFLSMFGRLCPVQYHVGGIHLQLFIPMEQQFNAFPVIHRQYIYFIIGKKNKAAFRQNPLKYIQINDFEFPQMPIRISIIGPPKCGKSALADRFRTELGLKVITKGQAARYVMNYLAHSKLGMSMEARLRGGFALKEKMVVNCVQACMYDPRAVTQGVLMDGFPNSPKDTKYLASLGLTPHLVLDLHPQNPEVYEYLSSEGAKQFEPPYSKHFMDHRYKVWNATQKQFRSWLITEYQNYVQIKVKTCIWDIWELIYDYVKAAVYEFKHYHICVRKDWPLRLSYMLVSPLEFIERQSQFKTYCPCCLYHFNKLTCGGFPPDRTGLVHFRKYFYYACPEHIEDFIENPELFLSPLAPNKMPAYLPEKLKLMSMPKNAYESGYCVTCYKDKMAGAKGDFQYASMFKEAIYLFDCDECQSKFSSTPLNYFNVTIPLKDNIKYPSLDYKDLPPLGTLEQFVARDIIKAIKSTTSIRPVVPGLSVGDSALLSVGLFLKMNNKRLDEANVGRFQAAIELMHSRKNSMLKYVELFKYYRNPYIHYSVPTPPLDIEGWLKDKFGVEVSFKPDSDECKEEEDED